MGAGAVQLPHSSNEFIAEAAFALPVQLGRQLEKMNEQIQQSGHTETKIAFTEWLLVNGRQGGAAPDYYNLGGAIITGGFMNMLLDHARIVPISDMTGIIEFAGIWKRREQVFVAPGYWVLRSYAEAAPEHLLPVESDASTYSVEHGVVRLPEIRAVPWLDVRAARRADGDVVLFCVNRCLEHDYRAAIKLRGFAPAKVAMVKTIDAPSIYDRNDEDDPDQVGVTTTQVGTGETTDFAFPSSSVVIMQFHPANKS